MSSNIADDVLVSSWIYLSIILPTRSICCLQWIFSHYRNGSVFLCVCQSASLCAFITYFLYFLQVILLHSHFRLRSLLSTANWLLLGWLFVRLKSEWQTKEKNRWQNEHDIITCLMACNYLYDLRKWKSDLHGANHLQLTRRTVLDFTVLELDAMDSMPWSIVNVQLNKRFNQLRKTLFIWFGNEENKS